MHEIKEIDIEGSQVARDPFVKFLKLKKKTLLLGSILGLARFRFAIGDNNTSVVNLERKKKKEKDPVSRRLNNGSSITHKVSMISFSLCRK